MTNSEILMIVFTAVIATTGVIGSIIFNNQLNVMQGQLSEMKTAGQDTKRAADAATEAAAAAKQSSDATIALERPMLFLAELKFVKSSETDPKPKVSYSITNLGRVTAGIRMIYADAMLKTAWGPPARFKQQKFQLTQQPLANGATRREQLFATFDTDFTPQDYADVASKKKSVLVQLLAVYEGPLNLTYTIAAAYMLDVESGLYYATGGDDYNFEKIQNGRAATLDPSINVIPAPTQQQVPVAK